MKGMVNIRDWEELKPKIQKWLDKCHQLTFDEIYHSKLCRCFSKEEVVDILSDMVRWGYIVYDETEKIYLSVVTASEGADNATQETI